MFDVNNFPGHTAGTVGYAASGGVFEGGVQIATYSPFSAGDVVGVAYDGETGDVWLSVNGAWQSGDPAVATSPTTNIGAETATQKARFLAALRNGTDTLSIASRDGLNHAVPEGFYPI